MESVYNINVPFAGYIRGVRTYSVKASSEEEALEKVRDSDYGHTLVKEVTLRDHTEEDCEDAYV